MEPRNMFFKDRSDAGNQLAKRVFGKFPKVCKENDAVVLALPRGGVPVAYEIAKKLGAPLNLIVTHKLGFPGEEELAIGAVAEDGSFFVDPYFQHQVSEEYLQKEKELQLLEIRKRIQKYRGGKKLPDLKNKIVFLVDDGIATGNTMQAALRLAKNAGAKKVVIAVPVLPLETLKKLEKECDVIYLKTPEPFLAIGRFYFDFEQLEDKTVRNYLFR